MSRENTQVVMCKLLKASRLTAATVALLWGAAVASPVTVPLNPPSRSGPQFVTTYQLRARLQRDRELGLKYPRLVRGDVAKKELALTFDDGPHPEFTPRLLELLRKHRVPATFFVVGKMVDKHPELVQQEIADGHEVANHTYHHYRLVGLSARQVEEELTQGRDAIHRAVGVPTRLFRPPGGEYDHRVADVVRRLKMVMVLWTDDPGDYALHSRATVIERAEKQANNGGIVLLHDGVEATFEALPTLIEHWRKQGYRFVTCSHMAHDVNAVIEGGPVVVPHPKHTTHPRRSR